MHTSTSIGKLRPGRRPWQAFLTFFAVLLGLGASPLARAQSTIASNSVNVAIRPTTGGFSATYNTQSPRPSDTPFDEFQGRNFGTFNLATDAFRLEGASFTINETDGNIFDQGELFFRVFPGTLASNTGATAFISIPLVNEGVVNGVRTFTLSNAARNLLASITTGGTPGASYRFDVFFSGIDNTTGDRPTRLESVIRRSVFTATGTRPAPTNIGNTNVIVARSGNANETFGASSGRTPLFTQTNLGLFDINTGQLLLNGGTATTAESFGDVVQNARLIYQVIKPAQNGASPVVFQQSTIFLPQVGSPTTADGVTTRNFSNTTAFRNLISGLANFGTGDYTITLRYESDVLRNNTVITLQDNNNGNGYTAPFTLIGVPIPVITWTGEVDDDWFNSANWDLKRLPDANTNVIIPDFGTGNTRPYPNINAGVSYTTNLGNGTIANGPVKDNTQSGPALSRNVDLQGSTQAQRSITRLVNGRWKVFGSFNNSLDSYIQRASGTVMEFAGSGNQTITGGSFTEIEMSGGGTKNLTGVMRIAVSLEFMPNGGLLTTDISDPDARYVELAGRSTDAPNGAQLAGESDAGTIPSYVRGFVRTTRNDVRANEVVEGTNTPDPRTFGNIGLSLLFTGSNNPGDVLVTRNTAEGYSPIFTNADGSPSPRYSTRRIFGVRPSSPNTGNGGLSATMTFRYLDSETRNLGPQGVGSIAEPNLSLFVSSSSGNQFTQLGRDAVPDVVNNILTKTSVRTFATFTLGDITAPLPVTLTAFEAKRAGSDAVLTWETATEKNNKGFFVEVSADGKIFRALGFVASHSANSSERQTYRFLDAEAGKSGNRYYRLNQVDLDDKASLSPIRVLDFGVAAGSATLLAFPNPFTDNLSISVAGAGNGTATLRLSDLTGRTLRVQQERLEGVASELLLENLGGLNAGIYMVQLTLPSGKVQNFKMQKQ
ncbi:T9SS type A sorting domain-containing protein [uncultured Hymenobacter sp.]|uniref:T9SS type A sorting domain-containing protein n=1 Tax=uncultured Hymenobacter sp. TaxID=170016 RepID=UPI0035CC5CEC